MGLAWASSKSTKNLLFGRVRSDLGFEVKIERASRSFQENCYHLVGLLGLFTMSL